MPKTTNVLVTVQSTTRIERVIIATYFPGLGYSEGIYDGCGFAPFYIDRSFIETLPIDPLLGGGYRFTLMRKRLYTVGWPDSPQIRVWAYEYPASEALLGQIGAYPVAYPLLVAYPYLS